MADDDAELVALIDSELDEASQSRLLARLADDEALRARYDALIKGRADLAAAFDTLLERAPIDRLRAAIPRDDALRPPGRGSEALRYASSRRDWSSASWPPARPLGSR